MIKKLQKKYALSEQGAKDLIKGCLACVLQNLSFMFPVGLLYYLVSDLMNGGVPGGKIPFYVAGCVVCIGLILLTMGGAAALRATLREKPLKTAPASARSQYPKYPLSCMSMLLPRHGSHEPAYVHRPVPKKR